MNIKERILEVSRQDWGGIGDGQVEQRRNVLELLYKIEKLQNEIEELKSKKVIKPIKKSKKK